MKKNKNTKSRKTAAEKPGPPETVPLSSVEQARDRLQTRALVFEHLAEHAARAFRGTETRGPSKLLTLPDGYQRPARLEFVVEIESELGRLAYEARSLMRKIREATVVVDPNVVAQDDIPRAAPTATAERGRCRGRRSAARDESL